MPERALSFNSNKCNKIVVKGAGYKDTDGTYYKSTSGRNDGNKNRRWWCKGSANNCYGHHGSIFNEYGGWGWGIQTRDHHRYQNRQFGENVHQFTEIRGSGGASHDGKYPIPFFYCAEEQ